MKLSDIKKNADAMAAEVEAARKRAQLMTELDVHPLLKWGCARDVRDAYFGGVIFAALTDDVEIDENERKAFERIGRSLAFSVEEIEELISGVSKTVKAAVEAVDPATGAGGDEVFAVLEECAVSLADDKIFRMFLAEYVKVCGTKKFDAKDVKDQVSSHVTSKIGLDLNQFIDEGLFDALCRVVQSGRDFNRDDLLKLSDWLGEDATRYFVLDVFEDDVKPILDAHRTMMANRAALPVKLVGIIEGDETWPVEFKPADYQPLFDAAGIAEADAGAFVARELLPFMKRACEEAKTKIGEVKVIHDDDSWKSDDDRYHGAKFETVKEFCALFRYAFFVDAFVDLNGIYEKYYFIGPQEGEHQYYLVSLTLHEDHITFKRIGAERFEGVERALCPFGRFGFPDVLFDRMRCGWGIYDDDIKRYFAQWEELFAAIEKRFLVNNSQDGGTAIQE